MYCLFMSYIRNSNHKQSVIDEVPMKGIINIINETEGSTDEDLLVYALTLVNKVNTCLVFSRHIFKK